MLNTFCVKITIKHLGNSLGMTVRTNEITCALIQFTSCTFYHVKTLKIALNKRSYLRHMTAIFAESFTELHITAARGRAALPLVGLDSRNHKELTRREITT